MKKLVSVSLFLCLLWAACTRPAQVPLPEATLFNIAYGADTPEQLADIYLPEHRNEVDTRVIVLLHGRAWVGGDKSEYNDLGVINFFVAHQCAVVNMNYRLVPKYPFPLALDDIDTMLSVVDRNKALWHINPSRIGIAGRSAGSHLAMLYAYSRNNSKRIKAVIDWYGPTDFTDSTVVFSPLGNNVAYMLGAYNTNRELWKNASPVNHMPTAVPTFIYYGDQDNLVFPTQSLRLFDSLKKRGIPASIVVSKGSGHGWLAQSWMETREASMTWLSYFL